MKKRPLPVDVRRSKTSLLKVPNVVSNALGISTSATCMAAENDDVIKSDISTSKIPATAVFFLYMITLNP